jgi:predicted acylesterase/phospholipase RssA
VGVSSGSIVAASLANGIDTVEMGRMFITNESIEFPLTPGIFLRPATLEYAKRARGMPRAVVRALARYARDPWNQTLASAFSSLGGSVPSGIFDNKPFERFLERLYSGDGRSNDFRQLARELYVVATDLNTGESVRFGEPGYESVPISRAVQASTALPGLYPPVRIGKRSYVDGALIRTMNASIALEQGADLVICMNPLVAFDATRGARRRLGHDLGAAGLPVILSQTFRALIQSRMYVGMASYRGRFPAADLLLFEPDRDDEQMFFVNVFRYADRQRLVDHAYQRTRRDLLANAPMLEPLLARHGLELRTEVLEARDRHFNSANEAESRARREVFATLDRTLDRLETALDSR